MKIVLTTGPRAESDLERGGLPFLGLGYIADWLERSNYDVVITDPHTFNWNVKKSVEEILKHNPEAVGLTSTTDNRLKTIELIRALKKEKPDLFILVGGPHFALTAKNALEKVSEIDVVIKAEGEITTKELLDVIQEEKSLSEVLGIFYRDKNGKIIETPNRPFGHDLGKFSVAWHLFDMDKYRRNIDGTNIRSIGVISSRGCPSKCIYCVNAKFREGGFRLRSPIKFVDEVEFLKNKFGFEGFDFWDDTLTVSKDHVRKICEEILKRKLNIKWYTRARVDTVDEEILKLMREAGCIRISYGVESGSPRILELIKKNITIEQAMKAAKLSSKSGMKVLMNFMVNLPYETMEDLKMTIDLMKRLNSIENVIAAYGFSIPYPGTEMELIARKEKIIPEDFSWNSDYHYGKYKIAGTDPSLPLMEWSGAEIEKIKAFMARELGVRGGILKKGIKKLKKVKSIKELKELTKTGLRYIKK